MQMMTKTNEKYSYEDFLLRKRILKQEINDIEKSVSLENLPNTLGMLANNIKDKTWGLIQNPNFLNLSVNTGIGFISEKILSKFINKKSIPGKIALIALSYLVPLTINKTKKYLTNKKKNSQISNN